MSGEFVRILLDFHLRWLKTPINSSKSLDPDAEKQIFLPKSLTNEFRRIQLCDSPYYSRPEIVLGNKVFIILQHLINHNQYDGVKQNALKTWQRWRRSNKSQLEALWNLWFLWLIGSRSLPKKKKEKRKNSGHYQWMITSPWLYTISR